MLLRACERIRTLSPSFVSRFRRSETAAIKVLCIVNDMDRPTVATVCGLQARGLEMSVVCPPDAAVRERFLAANVRVLDIALKKRIDLDGIRALRRELSEGRYDLLHAFSNRGLQNGIIALRGLPTRLVAYRGRVGNVSMLDPVSWMRYLSPRIDRLICVSDAVRDFFVNLGPSFLRAPADKYIRIYKGHDLAWYRDEPADLTAFGIPKGAFVAASVANYRPHKGIDHLVRALAHLPAEWPVHLLLVGRMENPGLDRLIRSLPAPERVHRIGYRADAPAIAAASDVFVLPSTIPEGLPRSVIEAMAYERACIVTHFGGAAELVVDQVSGLHVPPADSRAVAEAIARLYRDPGLRERIGQAAKRRIARDFNIERTIDETLAVYRGLPPISWS